MKPCPVECGRDRADDKCMCRTCWFDVPRPLRTDVNRTWHSYQRLRRGAKHRAIPDAIRSYRSALAAAIAAARERLVKREPRA